MRAGLTILVAVLLALAAAGSSAADGPTVTGLRYYGNDHLTVGDRFHAEIKVEADAGGSFALAPGAIPPELSLISGPRIATRAAGNGRQEATIDLELAAFVPGQVQVPPLRFTYKASDGSSSDFQTASSTLTVQSVLPQDSNTIVPRPLKPQLEIRTPAASPLPWVAAAGIAVAVAAAVAFAVWRRRVRRRPVAIALPEEPREESPEERARAALDTIAPGLTERGDYVEYYATVADTVRTYLSSRHGFPAFALTTRELQDQMVARGMDRWQARVVGGLLAQCDAVVYAGYRPAPERADADLTAAYEIVEMGRPAAEPEPAGALT